MARAWRVVAPTRAHTRGRRAGGPRARRGVRWSWIAGAAWKVYPSRAGGDTARGRPVGGPGDRAGLPGCADAARSRAAAGAVARARGRPPHSRPAPASRTHRWRTPSRTPPRGTAPCATARLWRSRRPAVTPTQGAEAMGDQANGGGGRRREFRWAAITRTGIPPVSRSHEIATNGTGSCRCDKRGARGRGVRPRRPAHPVPSRRSRRRRPLAPPPAPPVPTRLGHGQEWQGSGQDGEIVETIPRVCHWQSKTAHVGQLNTAHVGDRHLGLSGRSPVDALRRCGAGGHDAPFHKIPISHAGTVHRRPGRRDKAVPPRTIARDAVARPPRLLCRPARRVSPPRPRGLALSWRGSTGRLDAVSTPPPPVAPTSAAWRAAVRRAPDPRPARPGAGPAQARRRGGGPR